MRKVQLQMRSKYKDWISIVAKKHCNEAYREKISNGMRTFILREDSQLKVLVKPFSNCTYRDIFFITMIAVDNDYELRRFFIKYCKSSKTNYFVIVTRMPNINAACKYADRSQEFGVFDADRCIWIRYPKYSSVTDVFKKNCINEYRIKLR